MLVQIDLTGSAFDADTDGDGQTDWAEVLAGTDPNSSESVFAIKTIGANPDGTKVIRWSSVPGHAYRLLQKNSVSDPAWITVGDVVVASGIVTVQTDNSATSAPRRIYRVLLVE